MDTNATIPELQKKIADKGDMKAYEQLYHHLFFKLYYIAFDILKSKEAAEEIVSDVFIKVWQMQSRLNDIDNLRVYLYTTTKNLSINYISRYHKMGSMISHDSLPEDSLIEINTPEDLCISSDIIKKIKLAIQELPPQCKLILRMVKEDGLRYKEVAEILSISELTVRNQVAIAIKKMGRILPAYLEPSILSS